MMEYKPDAPVMLDGPPDSLPKSNSMQWLGGRRTQASLWKKNTRTDIRTQIHECTAKDNDTVDHTHVSRTSAPHCSRGTPTCPTHEETQRHSQTRQRP